MRRGSLLLFTIYTVTIWTTTATQDTVVKTSLGSIQGNVVKVPGANEENEVFEFIGIPYAQPPVGNLRFRKPEPVEPWTGTLEATKWSSICPQTLQLFGSLNIPAGGEPGEDCLYLNIWTPELKNLDHNPKKAVMVFIHGGGFISGAASQPGYYGAKLSGMGDVVVVTMNYRLGILGFLNLGVEEAPGNQGMWDQRLAMMWVKEHIEEFGGDPNQVTIFGESAGSMSVGAHVVSPMSHGLFQRAIMQSGSPFNPTYITTPQKIQTATINYAIQEGCHHQNEDLKNETVLAKTFNCLRQIEISRIMQAEDTYLANGETHFVLTYGDQFLPHQETGGLVEDDTSVELMIGVVANEGTLLLQLFFLPHLGNTFTMEEAKMVGKTMVQPLGNEHLTQQALHYYLGRIPENTSADELKAITSNIIGDYLLVCPTLYFAEYFSQQHTVYFYHFNHRHSKSTLEEWLGMVHTEELGYIFGQQMFPDFIDTDVEVEFGREIIDMWSTFAKTGKPKVPGDKKWPNFSADQPLYMDLKPNNYTLGIGPRLGACYLWGCHLYHLQ